MTHNLPALVEQWRRLTHALGHDSTKPRSSYLDALDVDAVADACLAALSTPAPVALPPHPIATAPKDAAPAPVEPPPARRPHACFSRSGWWQTLCGLDAANQGFGWTSDPARVGCDDCRTLCEAGEHERRPVDAYMKPKTGRKA
jgi:hypothetical protein